MGVDDPIEVRCLDPDKAWELFKKKVGERTLKNHPDIQKLARKVCNECHGLPLALNVIGETMACKITIQEWRHATDILSSAVSEIPGMEDKVLLILKYSCDSLKSRHVKSCFLYCSLFPEDSLMNKERLIEYWIGEGFINEEKGIKGALDQGYEIIGTLVRACLLSEEGEHKAEVKMHDVVRDMALWIASDLGKHKERFIVHAGVGLREIPKLDNWKGVIRISLMENDIKMLSESHKCPQLTTLLLGENRSLKTISCEFLRCMPKLLVLDLSNNFSLRTLLEEISGMVSLRYLDLSWTKIERLPVGLQELKMLIHLNFEGTKELKSLQGISNFSSLRTLKLRFSKVWLDKSLMKEMQLLEHLEFVSINITSSLVEKLLLYAPRMRTCIHDFSITGRPKESEKILVLPAMENLRNVIINSSGVWEIKIEETSVNKEIKIEETSWNKSLMSPHFSNLLDVWIIHCDGLRDLTWLLFAPKLSYLHVENSKSIKEIINEEKGANLLEKETCNILPFERLERLVLYGLPELKSIYWNALPFQHLKSLRVGLCPKLRKLPLDSKNLGKVEDLVIKYMEEEWKQEIEWEDEATRQHFLPQFKRD